MPLANRGPRKVSQGSNAEARMRLQETLHTFAVSIIPYVAARTPAEKRIARGFTAEVGAYIHIILDRWPDLLGDYCPDSLWRAGRSVAELLPRRAKPDRQRAKELERACDDLQAQLDSEIFRNALNRLRAEAVPAEPSLSDHPVSGVSAGVARQPKRAKGRNVRSGKGRRHPAKKRLAAPQSLSRLLRRHGFDPVDNRSSGGALWVKASERAFQACYAKMKLRGVLFKFTKNGGKATGHRPGWWTKAKG